MKYTSTFYILGNFTMYDSHMTFVLSFICEKFVAKLPVYSF